MDAAKRLQELNELQGRLEGALAYEEGAVDWPSQPEREMEESETREPEPGSLVMEYFKEGLTFFAVWLTCTITAWVVAVRVWDWLIDSGFWLILLILWSVFGSLFSIGSLLGLRGRRY